MPFHSHLRPLLAGLLVSLVPPLRAQEELAKLLPPELEDIAHFASSIAVGHGRILASDHKGGKKNRGQVHVFDLRTGKHLEVLQAKEPFSNDLFGYVAIGEKWVLISSRKATAKDMNSGAVHVFDPNTWQEVARITAPDGNNGQFFGNDIAVEGDLALVGAPYDDTLGYTAGAAYLLHLPTGALIHKWFGSDTTTFNFFGCCVALAGDRAIVSSNWNETGTGAAYVFDVTTGQELMKLQGSLTHPQAFFGYPIAIHGSRVLIGAYAEDDQGVDRSGAAYLFDLQTGAELRRFSSDQPTLRAGFGFGLDLNDRRALISVPGDMNYFTDLGRVQVYDLATGDLLETIEPADNAPGDLFGFPVVLHDCRVVIGSTWDDDLGKASGSAYLFRLAGDLGEGYCGPANLNSTGQPAVLRGTGCPCPGENLLQLVATQVPPNQFGYLLASETQGFVPFVGGSQGNLCLSGQIGRFGKQIQDSGSAGSFSIDVDLGNMPPHGSAVQPGETWNFQAWFRDKNPTPTSNFTDGVSVVFQ